MTTFLDLVRKTAQEKKENFIEKHYGPGPHKRTGTPQSIHAGARQRKGTPKGRKATNTSTREASASAISGKSLSEYSNKALMGAVDRIENMIRAQSKYARHRFGRVLATGKYNRPEQSLTPALDRIYEELAQRRKK